MEVMQNNMVVAILGKCAGTAVVSTPLLISTGVHSGWGSSHSLPPNPTITSQPGKGDLVGCDISIHLLHGNQGNSGNTGSQDTIVKSSGDVKVYISAYLAERASRRDCAGI